jgi:hypothetical protein
MRHLQTDITIAASPAQVWATLTQFDQYAEWNPFIQKIAGPVGPGKKISVELHLAGQKPQVFQPRVTVHEPGRELRWLGHLFIPGLFDGEHYFQLEALPGGGTRFIHGEHFRGLLAGLILRLIGRQTQEGFQRMNKALKARVEARN